MRPLIDIIDTEGQPNILQSIQFKEHVMPSISVYYTYSEPKVNNDGVTIIKRTSTNNKTMWIVSKDGVECCNKVRRLALERLAKCLNRNNIQ